MNGQFGGLRPFNVNSFSYPTDSDFVEDNYSADTAADLAEFIGAEMAGASCDASCVRNVAAYLWSLRTQSSEKISISNFSFDETGLKFDLSCKKTSALLVKVIKPDASVELPQSSYIGVSSRANGLATVDVSSIATIADNGEIALVGEGSNIWNNEVWFNGLAENIQNGKLDITLNIKSVSNVEHDFAKVGIMLSSTDDLSGQLLFLHWSGRSGIAEDSGTAALTGYQRLLANPDPTALTPTPTTLRVTYEDGAIKVGGCYNCVNPTMKNAARSVNFLPKRAFIVASSHNAPAILADLVVNNVYRESVLGEAYYQTRMACGTSSTAITVPEGVLRAVNGLKLAIYEDGELLAQKAADKTYSENASCEIQGELLEPKLRRLSEVQIMNSLRDIFGDIFTAQMRPRMEDGAKLIGMNTLADRLNINTINLERLYDSSRLWADRIIERNSDIKQCAQSISPLCVTTVLNTYAPRLWRRPITLEERNELLAAVGLFGSNEQRLKVLLNSLLLSSNFLFRSEIGTGSGDVRHLDNYEIVTLLAYTIWNSTPDQTLLTLASKTAPLSVAELQGQVDRMFADSRANAALVEIYKDYLKLEMGLTNEKAVEFGFTDQVRAELMASAELTLADRVAQNPGFMDAFGGSEYYVSQQIQSFFNMSVGSSSLELAVANPTQRRGILNHPMFLAAHSTLTHSGIIKRGVFTLEQILCEDLGAPPTEVESQELPDDLNPATTSERELLQLTHSSQPGCIGCHKFIDPAGFGFENFDAVGRYRTTEKGSVPIDASGVLETTAGTRLSFANSVEYTSQLVHSEQMARCVSRRFLEHYLSQELNQNACELKKYHTQVNAGGQTVKSLLDSLIRLESFSKRKQVQ